MFSGIVEELGEVRSFKHRGRNRLLQLSAGSISQDVLIGDSIAVNGTCLSVCAKSEELLSFEVMPQTSSLTNLGNLRIKDKVNLERSLKLGDRISGHFVYGHIDCVGVIRRKMFIRDNLCFDICVPAKFIPQISLRGSVAVDGTSLTVQDKKSNYFSVYIIPHTSKNTTLGFKGPSAGVNIEFDKLALPA
ncbi:MAG: riboflavin synthase [Candidatus Omnitrophica bacterium]|nr:riboflavin synthase [Candidatus Omnitrophota bacterium]